MLELAERLVGWIIKQVTRKDRKKLTGLFIMNVKEPLRSFAELETYIVYGGKEKRTLLQLNNIKNNRLNASIRRVEKTWKNIFNYISRLSG